MGEVTPKGGFGKKLGIGCLILIGGVVALGVLGVIIGEDGKAPTGQPESSMENSTSVAEVADLDEPADSLTGPQRNAARSARQYLDMTGFSREGLIDQLSSDAGNGYEVADATAAVDSLGVDWNEQAVRSAKQYLDLMGFSCNGLVDQLSSSAGSQYTVSEAKHGARQAGAC